MDGPSGRDGDAFARKREKQQRATAPAYWGVHIHTYKWGAERERGDSARARVGGEGDAVAVAGLRRAAVIIKRIG